MLDGLIAFYELKSDVALARLLGYTDGSAIGNMRRRNSIDLMRVVEKCPEVDLQTLVRYGVARRVRDAPFMHLNVDTGEILSHDEYEKQLKEYRQAQKEKHTKKEE